MVIAKMDRAERPDRLVKSRPSTYSWYIAGLICLASTISVLDRYLFGVVLEPIKHDLSLTDTQLAVIQGPSFVTLFVLASLPLGRLADVGDRRLIIATGLAFWSLSTVACAFVHSFSGLLIARMAVGLGEAALLPSAMSLLASYFTADRMGRASAFYTVGGPLGKAFAFIGGGALIALFSARGGVPVGGLIFRPWQFCFLIAGLAGIIVSLLFLLTVREPRRGEAEARELSSMGDSLAYFSAHASGFLAIFVPFAMFTAVTQQLASWSVSYYAREHGATVGTAAAIIGFTGLIIGPLGQVIGGFGGDHLNTKGRSGLQPIWLATGMTLASVFTILFALAPRMDLAALAFAIAQLLLNCGGPIAYGALQIVTPDRHRGIISSLFLLTYTVLGTGAGPLVVALVNDYVLNSEGMLRQSIVISTLAFAVLGVSAAIFGRRAFLRLVDAKGGEGDAG